MGQWPSNLKLNELDLLQSITDWDLKANFEFKAKSGESMSDFIFWIGKTAKLWENVLPIVKSGDQTVTANLRELPISNLPIARIYCIIRVTA